MSGTLIDGKALAAAMERELEQRLRELAAQGIRPGLTAVRVGDDPASLIYVRSKARKAEELGIHGVEKHCAATITEEELIEEIAALNRDDAVDGILVQLPLPRHINARRIVERIDPAKDVDGFHPVNVGRLHLQQPTLVPCTPAGIIRLIESTGETIAGKHAVVIGRSDIVGKPVSALLLARDATVTTCHSKTTDLPRLTRSADILVAAIGRPHFVQVAMVKQGAIVVDVGINRIERREVAETLLADHREKMQVFERNGSVVVGDVDFDAVRPRASWITPVPGGVGPMTIIMLLSNTIDAARGRRSP